LRFANYVRVTLWRFPLPLQRKKLQADHPCHFHSGKAAPLFCNCLLYCKQFREEMTQAYAAEEEKGELALAA